MPDRRTQGQVWWVPGLDQHRAAPQCWEQATIPQDNGRCWFGADSSKSRQLISDTLRPELLGHPSYPLPAHPSMLTRLSQLLCTHPTPHPTRHSMSCCLLRSWIHAPSSALPWASPERYKPLIISGVSPEVSPPQGDRGTSTDRSGTRRFDGWVEISCRLRC